MIDWRCDVIGAAGQATKQRVFLRRPCGLPRTVNSSGGRTYEGVADSAVPVIVGRS